MVKFKIFEIMDDYEDYNFNDMYNKLKIAILGRPHINVWFLFDNEQFPITISSVSFREPKLKQSINKFLNEIPNKIFIHKDTQTNFIDSYQITLILKSDSGKQYTEIHNEMSLSDFEIMYGNITDEIISMNVSKIERNE